MASRAISRSRKSLSASLNQNQNRWLVHLSFPSFDNNGGGGSSSLRPDSNDGHKPSTLLPSSSSSTFHPNFVGGVLNPTIPLDNGFLSYRSCRISSAISRNHQVYPSLGSLWVKDYQRYSSIATAGLPGGDDEKSKESGVKQKKETSPEECDQAVEGLSSVKAKAKAKAKQLKQTKKVAQKLVTKIWDLVLGIGPALKAIASMSRADWKNKLIHWKDEFKSTLQHYWLGTKLLWADTRICFKLLSKLANGKSLSRRERKQLTRTTADIFRLVPFAVFIVVPFMEFLLPVFLKLFPNMLPSTFQDKMKEQESLKKKLTARIEYAKFLQETAKEMAKEVKDSRSGEVKHTAEALDEFLNKVRKGAHVANDEILSFAKLFNDELTLDSMSRPRLVNMCKYMGINPYGTDAFLRHMLRKRLREIKEDDKMIQAEGGVESLSDDELQQDCRDRGMLGLATVEEMRQQLRDWLDLSLNHSVPSSLLILSRAFIVAGKVKAAEALKNSIVSLPDEVVDVVQVTSLSSEDLIEEKRRKLEYLNMQEELMKEEEDDEKEEEELARMKETFGNQKDIALGDMIRSTEIDNKRPHTRDKEEQLCELSRALAVLASASSVSREREEFLRLVSKEVELYNSMVEKEGAEGEDAAINAYRAAREDRDHAVETDEGDNVSSALIDRVDSMLHKLEKEIDEVDATIGDHWRFLDRDYDGKVTPEEVASAAAYLKDALAREGIEELVAKLTKDKDGKILVEDLKKLGCVKEDDDLQNNDDSGKA